MADIMPDADNGALRHDAGKSRYDLIPPDFMHDLAGMFAYNLQKYPARNWERGMDWSRCFASLMRHSWAWARGHDIDPETGQHHMMHAAWNCMALAVYARRKIGRDDRPAISPDAGVVGLSPQQYVTYRSDDARRAARLRESGYSVRDPFREYSVSTQKLDQG